MNIEEKIIDVMKGMEGIGGVPTPSEYYAEFDMRVKAALGLVGSDFISHVSVCFVVVDDDGRIESIHKIRELAEKEIADWEKFKPSKGVSIQERDFNER